MNPEDKAEYHNSLIKNMTRKCHDRCFKSKEEDKLSKISNFSKLDSKCLSICYHKYINVITKLKKITQNKGDKLDSEFVLTVFDTRFDPVLDYIWTKGGSRYMYGAPTNFVLKYVIHKEITPYKGYSPFRDKYENQ